MGNLQKCPFCDRTHYPEHMTWHVYVQHMVGYACWCGAYFDNTDQLQRHFELHGGLQEHAALAALDPDSIRR